MESACGVADHLRFRERLPQLRRRLYRPGRRTSWRRAGAAGGGYPQQARQLDGIQKELLQYCYLIQPAYYHRGYDVREPIEVRVNPGSIEILSYPGPDPSIRTAALNGERILSRRYRNRRIGEFLKELELAEGRFTGIPKMRLAMRQNGSPPPHFETDEGRTFFAVELLIHPAFEAHDEAHDETQVALNETERHILHVLDANPKSVPELAAILGYKGRSGHFKKALERLGAEGLIALTLPAAPRSKLQKRRLTVRGRRCLEAFQNR
jgi:ATP-dependent DNA helicase RecG